MTIKYKDPKKVERGKKSRASGSAFELRVRKDLESQGWTVDKWSNNIEFNYTSPTLHSKIIGTDFMPAALVPAKRKYLGSGRPMAIGTGFPDLIAFKRGGCSLCYARMGRDSKELFDVVGVECKTNGYLDRGEKEKCRWLLDNNIFSKILIAEKTKVKNRIVIVYHDFKEKYGS